MATKADLQKLAALRLREAESLFQAGLYDGCVYLCGYVVELALKACICKTLNEPQYPDTFLKSVFRTHEFDELAVLAGIKAELAAQKNANTALSINWNLATQWKPERRYQPEGTFTKGDAESVLNSIKDPDGVLTWLTQRW
jgi:HEPN domain-containing protein